MGLEAEAASKHEGEYICPMCIKKTDDVPKGNESFKGSDSYGKRIKKEEPEETQKTLYEAPLTEPVKRAVLELFDDLEVGCIHWSLSLTSRFSPQLLVVIFSAFLNLILV